MRKRLWILLIPVVLLVIAASTSRTPILRGVLQSNLDGGGYAITNVSVTADTVVSTNFIGNGAGLTNLPSSGGSSNITDSGYTAVITTARSTNGFITVLGTNTIYSLVAGGSDYERYLFEPRDKDLTLRADTAGTGDDNLSIRLMPVGTGAFYLDNAAATAGNTRGSYAVDLCMSRVNPDTVASGNYSFNSGWRSTASGTFSVAMGGANKASGQYSAAIGGWGTANNYYSISLGNRATSYLVGQVSVGSGYLIHAQSSLVTCIAFSSGNTSTNLMPCYDNNPTRIALRANTSWSFCVRIVARTTDAGTGDEESAVYEITGLIERDNTAAATRIVGSTVVTEIAEDDPAWTVSATADTTNGALQINVQGNNETSVRWVGSVLLTEVEG